MLNKMKKINTIKINRKYKKIKPTGCLCIGKKRIISAICGCVNPLCNFDIWKCMTCNTKKRYKSWIIRHCKSHII